MRYKIRNPLGACIGADDRLSYLDTTTSISKYLAFNSSFLNQKLKSTATAKIEIKNRWF